MDLAKLDAVGLVFEPENAVDLCEKLAGMRKNRELYEGFRKNCLSGARNFDRTALAAGMIVCLTELATTV